MRIGIIIFNLTVILFIICLIYLYVYVNYKYENFTTGTTSIMETTVAQNYLNNVSAFNSVGLAEAVSSGFDGNSQAYAFPAVIVPRLKKNFEAMKIAFPDNARVGGISFPDGYYWIKFGSAAGRYIYCIMNEAYYGGGWMLAMRGVKNSTTFNYDSSYWTDTRTLNDDWETINAVLRNQKILNINTNLTHQEIKSNTQLQTVSSLGDAIYRNDLEGATFDMKTDAFNNYNAREWMAIFYYKPLATNNNPTPSPSRGGDIISLAEGGTINGPNTTPLATANGNTRGWIWREAPRSTAANSAPQPIRQLFADRIPSSTNGFTADNNKWEFLSRYGLASDASAKLLEKWSRKTTDTGTALWSGQNGFSFYGINWQVPGTGNGWKVRWGFVWNNETNEITSSDSACGIGMKDYSCRDHYAWAGTEIKGINESIAFEFYVR